VTGRSGIACIHGRSAIELGRSTRARVRNVAFA
jgi:hypothetical protein